MSGTNDEYPGEEMFKICSIFLKLRTPLLHNHLRFRISSFISYSLNKICVRLFAHVDVNNSSELSTDKLKSSSRHCQRVSSSPHSRSRSRSRSSGSYRRHSRRHHSNRSSDSRSNSSRSSSRSYSRSGSHSRSRSRSRENDGAFHEKDPRDRSMRHRWSNNVRAQFYYLFNAY